MTLMARYSYLHFLHRLHNYYRAIRMAIGKPRADLPPRPLLPPTYVKFPEEGRDLG